MAQGSYILEEAQPRTNWEQAEEGGTIGDRNNKRNGNNKVTEKGRSLLLSETQEDTGLQC